MRSNEPEKALALWLESMARKSGAHAAAVATADGFPIASFGDLADWPLAVAGSVYAAGDRAAALGEIGDVDARKVPLREGLEVVLASCGVPVPAEVERHVRRILE